MLPPAAPTACWRLVHGEATAGPAASSDSRLETTARHHVERDRPLSDHPTVLATLERIVAGTGHLEGDAVGRAAARRLLGHLRRVRVPQRLLCTILDASGRVRGGALALPSPGRSAQVLSSRPARAEEVPLAAQAIASVVESLHQDEASIAQALLEEHPTPDATLERHLRAAPRQAESGHPAPSTPVDSFRQDAFLLAGFRELATLDYLARPLPRRDEFTGAELPPDVSIQPWRLGDQSLLAALDATYEATQDCPGLLGLRRTEDILAGHLAAGRFVPGLWSMLLLHGKPAGVLLLSPSHAGDEIDLVYLGLAAAARGRGLGRALLTFGLRQIAGRRERRLVLAVDRANRPAAGLYRTAGFVRIGSRCALVRPLDAAVHGGSPIHAPVINHGHNPTTCFPHGADPMNEALPTESFGLLPGR